MLYSKTSDQLVFVIDRGPLQEPIDDIVSNVYSSIKGHQATKLEKTEIEIAGLIQEIRKEPRPSKIGVTCFEGSESYKSDETLVHDDMYHFDLSPFEFQDTSFLVPEYRLLQESSHFTSLFKNSSTWSKSTLFRGVTADNFRGLMRYLYPLDPVYELTVDDWISTLRLSTKWQMITVRKEAIRRLETHVNLAAITKVELGNECTILEWVRSGYMSLIERHWQEHFTDVEVNAIGLHRATKLCELREKRLSAEWDTYLNRLTLEVHGTSNLISDTIPYIGREDDQDDDLIVAILYAPSLGNRRLVLDAWERMAKRTQSLTLDEAQKLGVSTCVKLWKVRLETRRAAWSLVQEIGASYLSENPNADLSKQILDAFKEEFEDIELEARCFSPLTKKKKKVKAQPVLNN